MRKLALDRKTGQSGAEMSGKALIVGCGFTGQRAARMLLRVGWDVTATSRSPENLGWLEGLGARLERFDAAHEGCIQAAAEGAHGSPAGWPSLLQPCSPPCGECRGT